MFRGIFAPGFMSGYDNSLHYYESYYLTQVLIPQYHWISGWSMQQLAGCPVLLDYPQVGFLLIAFLNKIAFLSLNLSYKAAVLFSYIILAAGFYKVTSCRFGKMPSLFAATCLMLQKDIYHDRILGGVWNNYLAIGIFLLFFHMLDKYIRSMSLRKSLILGLLLGLLILAHLYVALFAFILLSVYAFPYLSAAFREKKAARRLFFYALIPITAGMVSAYYLYGFVIARDYFAGISSKGLLTGLTWSVKSLFGPLEKGANLPAAFLINFPVLTRVIFGSLGAYLFLRKEENPEIRRFLTCTAVFSLIALVLFSDILVNLSGWWRGLPFVGNLQSNRFLVYAHVGMYIFAAYAAGRVLAYFKERKFIITAFSALMLLSVFSHHSYLAGDASRTLDESPEMANIYKVWDWIDENIPPGTGRIVYQSTRENTDDAILRASDVFALSGVFTDVPQIGVSRSASPFPQEKYMRNDYGSIFSRKISAVDDAFIRDRMNYFNAKYIVSVEPDLKDKLESSPLFFREQEYGSFTVFRLDDFNGGWIKFKGDAEYEIKTFENQKLEFLVRNKTPDNEAFLKVAYHPLWRARLNDAPIKIKGDRYGLMKISLPERGLYRLELAFTSFNRLWAMVSFLAFAGALLFCLRPGTRGIRCL
jgi:hypothetical protein